MTFTDRKLFFAIDICLPVPSKTFECEEIYSGVLGPGKDNL